MILMLIMLQHRSKIFQLAGARRYVCFDDEQIPCNVINKNCRMINFIRQSLFTRNLYQGL